MAKTSHYQGFCGNVVDTNPYPCFVWRFDGSHDLYIYRCRWEGHQLCSKWHASKCDPLFGRHTLTDVYRRWYWIVGAHLFSLCIMLLPLCNGVLTCRDLQCCV